MHRVPRAPSLQAGAIDVVRKFFESDILMLAIGYEFGALTIWLLILLGF